MCHLQNIALESVTDGQRDRQTDRQMDDGQSDPYVSLCFAGDTKIRSRTNIECHKSAHVIGIAKLKHCELKRINSKYSPFCCDFLLRAEQFPDPACKTKVLSSNHIMVNFNLFLFV